MARKQIVSTVGAANLQAAEVETAKQFEVTFVRMFNEDAEKKNQWLELAIVAPTVFGVNCFDKEKVHGKDGDSWSEDYLALKETLEAGLYMVRHNEPMPEIKRAAKGEILTAQEQEKRDRVASVRGGVSFYINQMRSYYAKSMDIPKDEKAKPTFTQWAGTAHVALTGKPETTKSKAVAPKISGAAPQVLLDLLAVYTIADNKAHREAFEAWADGVAKLAAQMKAATAISAIQNRPRVTVKSDTPKRTAKVAA